MSYQVIARKYRPQRFSDVVGQEHVTQTLGNAIAQNRIAHAYLFVGPRGTGKTTIARIFAMCLNCTGGPKTDYDEADPRCKEIAEGRSLDVLEIDGASNNGVDQVRELRETCRFVPATGRFKIYIIDEVHMLTTAAFNALLKTLEEPPAHVKFMFATTEPEKVLATILSRCQRFDLRRIPTPLIVKHLGHIARQENVDIEEPALQAIARGADGGMRDAESALDQLISFCGGKIVEPDVLSMYGLTAQSRILALAEAVLAGDAGGALKQLNELARQGKDLGRLLSDLLNYFRNLLVYRISGGDLSLVEVSESEAAVLREHGDKLPTETLTRIMEILTEGEGSLREATSKKIQFEVILLKAIEARSAVSIDALLQQLHALRGEAGAAVPTASSRAARPSAARTVEKAATIESPAFSRTGQAPAAMDGGRDLNRLWSELLEALGRVSQFARSYFVNAQPVSFAKNVLTIGFDPEFADQMALANNPRNHALLQTKLHEMGCGQCQVKFIQAEAAGPSATPPPAPAQPAVSTPVPNVKPPAPAPKPEPVALNKEDFKNDPLIQKALEIFKGQIVDVRA